MNLNSIQDWMIVTSNSLKSVALVSEQMNVVEFFVDLLYHAALVGLDWVASILTGMNWRPVVLTYPTPVDFSVIPLN